MLITFISDIIVMEISKKIFKRYLLPNIVKPMKNGIKYIYRQYRSNKI